MSKCQNWYNTGEKMKKKTVYLDDYIVEVIHICNIRVYVYCLCIWKCRSLYIKSLIINFEFLLMNQNVSVSRPLKSEAEKKPSCSWLKEEEVSVCDIKIHHEITWYLVM